ncbi:MAG TPA: hypothetical protein VFO10_05075 [Oligoflexus sp.]|uniref:hypothetical protein n=1 Tax=Oligoflexus sp. TaxID=1971216 RepID=UPI002D7F7E9A|nr:hypothetical protein [Oligoflexus sp.]HET9236597.1 hypothetical protein [Oligoflexus sp.]
MMKFQRLSTLFLLLLLGTKAYAGKTKFQDLPESGLVLLDSSVIPTKDLHYTNSHENGYLVLRSTLSPQWHKGIYFNLQNGRVTVPGVGASDLVPHKDGYSWKIVTKEATFEKKGEITLSRLARGCEFVWTFSVISRGQTLLNESGRLGYTCSTGSYEKAEAPLALERPAL